jgi:mono/diheme cytochrome c family protein
MRRRWTLVAAFLPLLASCQKSSDPVARGRAYFVGLGCKTCHAVAGEGGQVGPDLTYVGFRKSAEMLDLWLKDPAAWKPGTVMPNYKLRPEIQSDLIAYLLSLKGEAYRQRPPWDEASVKDDPIKRGESLFNLVGCVGCHGSKGAGGFPNNNVVGGAIPSLTFTADGYSKEELKTLLRDGRLPVEADAALPPPLNRMPPWGELLADDELDSLVEYVFSLRPPKSAEDEW